MSRYYRMELWVDCIDQDRREAIREAANAQWRFTDWDGIDEMRAAGDGDLSGGESEKEFAERVARAVVKANDSPCEVEVTTTYLEEIPSETYCFRREDFNRLTGQRE